MAVDWSNRGTYIGEKHGVRPADATQAVDDPNAAWFDPDPASKSGKGVRVIGFCVNRADVLVVILLPKDEQSGEYWGVNSWPANARDRRIYNEGIPT